MRNIQQRRMMERAIKLFGSEQAVGDAIGYSQHAVNRAKATGVITTRMAYALHSATDGELDCKLLCPELNIEAQLRKLRRVRPQQARG